MEKSKKFRMPSGIRNKLMAAIAMLLVSSIMMVSSTYAWFTLSTAPEVTGITTSVGANGNLEMALLNTKTFGNMGNIKSAVGDSAAVNGVSDANITWGNLIDLSDASYGLNLIALNPAALNYVTETQGDGEGAQIVVNTNKVTPERLLQTAEYGSDGRVTKLIDNTVAGIYKDAKWVTTEMVGEGESAVEKPAYGVRAIGVDSNMSVAQIVLNAAKSAVNAGVNGGASSGVSSAVNSNKTTFMKLAMSMQDASPSYTAEDVLALKAVATGVQTSLNTIVKTYSNAVLAKIATDATVTEEQLSLLRTQLSGNASASTLISLMSTAGVTDDEYTTRLNALATAQNTVKDVLTACDTVDVAVAADVKEQIVKPLIGTSVTAYGEGVDPVENLSMDTISSVKSVYVTGGLVATIAAETGTYQMTIAYEIPVYAGTKGADTGYLAAVANKVAELSIADTGNAETTIADFYGYVLDFAFRTNASNSQLQLQTTPANRVYSDAEGENLATQGSGSTATFAFDAAVLKAEQVETLLGAVNLVFLSPADGAIYGTAELTNVVITNGVATADVKMVGQTGEVAPIVALQQNQPKAVSVLVYLNGNEVDNSAVANAASSGMLNLNLQFSSSATLIPMENSALKNMVITYTELSDNNYKVGLYSFNGALYTVNANAKIYNGSDGVVYFSTDDGATYTKLTVVNAATALSPITVSVSSGTSNIVEKNGAITLTATVNGVEEPEITSITWESKDDGIAAIDGTATGASVSVVGVAAGNADIEATVNFTFTDGTVTVTQSVKVPYTVTVTETVTQTPEQP